jgi:6-phosphogluconolactonase (cycloisomerase 2 family)
MSASSALPKRAQGQQATGKVGLYANVGRELLHYEVDVDSAALSKRDSIELPANVQYAWPHVSGRYLYVASASGAEPGKPAENHLTAVRLDPATGDMALHGASVRLPVRPIHLTTDINSEHILVAFNKPSGVRVFRVNEDCTIGGEIREPGVTDGGIYAHQIRITPDNRHAILVTRGISTTATTPEAPGALKMFDYRDGVLSNEASVAPNGNGLGFGPRHLDFHPGKPWVYVSLERQSKMFMYRLNDGRIEPEAAYIQETLENTDHLKDPRQLAGTVHVHPNGRFVYGANRADGKLEFKGKQVLRGGENNIVVYAIDQTTGAHKPIQFADTKKVYARTFHIDPSGRMMIAQHNLPVYFRYGDDVRLVPAGLTVFRIGEDGKLTFVRVYDIDVGKEMMFWMGMVART